MKQSAFIRYLRTLPIDIGQGEYQRTTGGKYLAWQAVPRPAPGARAVDVGCGDGYWSERLVALGYDVVAFDQPRTYPNQDSGALYSGMIACDLNSVLPLPDRSMDLVWCTEVIEHLDNPSHFISEIKRVLKSGGRAFITTPNSFFWLSGGVSFARTKTGPVAKHRSSAIFFLCQY